MLGESDPSSASRKHAEPPPLPKSIVQPPPSIATAATSKPARPRRKLIILLSVAVALLIAVSVWALWHSHNKSPRASDYRMGAAYATGLGVPQDYAKAMEWYRKGAAKGNGDAMCGVGWLYYDGHGVPQDYAKAMEWFRKGAAAGNGGAMVGDGWEPQSTRGVHGAPSDLTSALRLASWQMVPVAVKSSHENSSKYRRFGGHERVSDRG